MPRLSLLDHVQPLSSAQSFLQVALVRSLLIPCYPTFPAFLLRFFCALTNHSGSLPLGFPFPATGCMVGALGVRLDDDFLALHFGFHVASPGLWSLSRACCLRCRRDWSAWGHTHFARYGPCLPVGSTTARIFRCSPHQQQTCCTCGGFDSNIVPVSCQQWSWGNVVVVVIVTIVLTGTIIIASSELVVAPVCLVPHSPVAVAQSSADTLQALLLDSLHPCPCPQVLGLLSFGAGFLALLVAAALVLPVVTGLTLRAALPSGPASRESCQASHLVATVQTGASESGYLGQWAAFLPGLVVALPASPSLAAVPGAVAGLAASQVASCLVAALRLVAGLLGALVPGGIPGIPGWSLSWHPWWLRNPHPALRSARTAYRLITVSHESGK